MSEEDRVGARPLSAFHTADIVQQQQVEEEDATETTIGIAPLFLLQDPKNADPPLTENDDASSEEYHSPLEEEAEIQEEEARKPMISASPYDYDVNWDMVGQLRMEEEEETKQETSDELNTTSCSSLAEAAAASMLASSSAAAAEAVDEEEEDENEEKKSFFRKTKTPRRPYSYQYQQSDDPIDEDEQQHTDTADPTEEDETARGEANDFIVSISATTSIDPPPPSEMNESINTTTSTSSSSGSSMTHRRRFPPQRRYPRATSAPLTRPSTIRTRRSLPSDDSSGRSSSSSLDSGMAAVRRWIRSRSAGSSRAARMLQREQDTSRLQLGEEDIFALTNAGEDPRGHFDDSYRTPFPSIMEEEEAGLGVRQRALSEPDGMRVRNFFFQRAAHGPSRGRRRRSRGESSDDGEATSTSGSHTGLSNSASVPTHLSSAALNSSLFHSPQRQAARPLDMQEVVATERGDGDVSSLAETSVPPSTGAPMEEPTPIDDDPNREARTRWIRINRRFQLIITVVALVFSLLLFAILVCWIVFTSAYVVSIDKPCDVSLKTYFWLATLQLILDVFRTDIMRFIFRWDNHSNGRIPCRVIAYNIAYLIYALLVLRLGIRSVFMADASTCPKTAPELYQSAAVFVSLSIAAWSTIVLGYLVPFCFVATLLTWNGYTPSADTNRERVGTQAGVGFGGVFPAAYSSSGAPPGCIDQLRTVMLEEFPEDYPRECCICMGDFVTGEVIVATECQHVFHKRCCQEWLRQARTCPVCRMDIPSSLAGSGNSDISDGPAPPATRLTRPFPGREEFHQDVVGLLQILRRQEERLRQRSASTDTADPTDGSVHEGAPQVAARSESMPVRSETEMSALEEGRVSRQHSS